MVVNSEVEMDWQQTLSRLGEAPGLSDDELADRLGVTRQMLSDARSGLQELPVGARMRVMDALTQRASKKALSDLLPPGVHCQD